MKNKFIITATNNIEGCPINSYVDSICCNIVIGNNLLMKKIFISFVCLLAILYGCSKDRVVTKISFDKNNYSLKIGESLNMTVSHTPSDIAAPIYSWVSDNPSIVSVDNRGRVTANKLGSAIITVSSKEPILTASCTISSSPVMPTSIKLNKEHITLKTWEKDTLICSFEPENITDKTVNWNSSNEDIVTVSNSGEVTAIAVGTATITASSGNLSSTCVVEAVHVPVKGVKLQYSSLTIEETDIVYINFEIIPSGPTNKKVRFYSNDNSIATFEGSSGCITAHKVGKTKVFVETEEGSIKDSCEVEVKTKGIFIYAGDRTEIVGNSFTIEAYDVYGNAFSDIHWDIDSENIVSILEINKNVISCYPKSIGKTVLTASTIDGAKKATCVIDVVEISSYMFSNYSGLISSYIDGYITADYISPRIVNNSPHTVTITSLFAHDGTTPSFLLRYFSTYSVVLLPGEDFSVKLENVVRWYNPVFEWEILFKGGRYKFINRFWN